MWRISHYANGIRDEQAFLTERQFGERQSFALTGLDVVAIGQTDPGLAATDEFDDHRIPVHQERFIGRQATAPGLPSFVTPTLAQGQKVSRGGAKQRLSQSHFAAPHRIGEIAQGPRGIASLDLVGVDDNPPAPKAD